MATSTLEIIIDGKGATSGANTVTGAVNQIKSGFIELAAKVFFAERAIAQVWAQATAGARFEETMIRLNRQMSTFHSTAQTMVTDLQAISQNTIGIDKAATLASRALSVGLDPSQVKTFTQAAMLLKNVMGTELPQAFDEIVQAAISGRGAVLGNIGVYVDLNLEVQKLAVATDRTTAQITKQEKVMIAAKAITDQIGESTRRLSDGLLSDADRLKQVEAKWDNLWTTIGQGAKTATISALDSLSTLSDYIKEHLGKFLPGAGLLKTLPSGESFGPPNPGNLGLNIPRGGEPPLPMPTALRGGQLEAEFARQDALRTGDLGRTKTLLEAKAKLYETDVQQQILTAEDVVRFKGTIQLQEIAKAGEALNIQLAKEQEFSAQRKKIGFDSTEERISEEKRHQDKVVEITQALYTNAQALGIQSDQNEADRQIARNTAETALGERTAQQLISKFAISEELRQKDFDATQVYYQGEADMAVARFASDSEIAKKERELLREQLAFKLRLTQDEADRLLFLRKAGDFEGIRQISGRADQSLGPRAVEGIIESATSKDILAAERANGDFFAGWARGLQKYAQDRDTAFGMSTDMARRTAQAMEQGFQTFFFKSMEGQFHSFKDVLQGVLDFTKQIISQIMAQMVTVGLVKPGATALMSFGGSFFASGAQTAAARGAANPALFGPGFASGGSFTVGGAGGIDSQRIGFMATPGEHVMITPPGQQGGAALAITMPVTIVNQVEGAQVETRQSTGAGGMPQLEVLITKMINKAVGEGRIDPALRTRFGLTPGER